MRPVQNIATGAWEYHNHTFWGFKASKRGNDVYQGRVWKRLNPLFDFMAHNKGKYFFSPKERCSHSTSVLMVTLTYDTKLNTVDYAWRNQGHDFNKFLSRIKQEYGRISVLRSWERYSNGYPHVHAVILFHDHQFDVRKHKNRNGKGWSWIVSGSDNKKISSFHHSYVQQSGVYSFGGIGYVAKYISKKVFEKKGNPTLVSCWLYGKQQWSISRNFIQTLHELLQGSTIPPRLDTYMHNSINSYLDGVISWYVGVKIVPNHGNHRVIRLRAPPGDYNYAGFDDNLYKKYENHQSWLESFVVSGLCCDKCGFPLFNPDVNLEYGTKDETIQFKDEGSTVTLCRSCYSDDSCE